MEIANFGVEEWLNVYETQATLDIAQSTIASMTMSELMAISPDNGTQFYQDLVQQKMNYGAIEGSEAFKQAVSELYQTVNSNQVLQTNGATGANLLALYALVKPGNHVITMFPTYQQLYEIPISIGATVSYWQLDEANNWVPDIAELKKLIRPETKLICLNNANNPTGTVISTELMQAIVEVARTVGAYVLVDEVYLPLGEGQQTTSIADLYELGIATNSLSKTYSVPGIRVGWLVANETLTDLFRKYRDYTMICAGVFSDQLAVYVLQNRKQVLARNRALVQHNLEIFKAWVAQEPLVDVVYPESVSTSFIHFKEIEDDEAFCKYLLKEYGVLLVPGKRFEIPGHARLGYCAPEATLKKGLAELSKALRTY
ncbi:aminotransferase [Latilactobacillus sakei]|uniref:Aminotransferase n=1 Tax=Latilactobacillus sakei TaxID=1599 RepID=A0AAE8LWF5_LATSK|nr:aminotransferase [Latilactobacillus sakei]USS39037.1 aminotransferase [Latilactobacillus sakei]SPE21822.1 Capreomycidine synthase [Latilactobacillus sakei]